MKPTLLKMIVTGLFLFGFAAQAAGDPNPTQEAHRILENLGVTFSGTIEIEAAYQDTDAEDTSDITLATVEAAIEAKPVRHVSGHIVFLWEEDETEPVEVDQGYIRLDGEDKCPFYAEAGRRYLPFGRFDSHFITNPLTQDLGETRETALVAGYASDAWDISAGAFNGDINESGEDDDMIDGFTAAAVYTMPQQGGFSLSAGVSYLSNIADSDSLYDQLSISERVASYVPAVAAFLSVDLNEAFFGTLEYVTATDDFAAGDVNFDGGREVQPWAVNAELAYAVTSKVEVGIRYGATGDAGDFLPETQYGAVVNFSPMDPVGLGLEYLVGEFDDGSDTTTVTLQLALVF